MTIAERKLQLADKKIKMLEEYVEDHINQVENRAILCTKLDTQSGKHQIYIAQLPNLSSFATNVSIEIGIIAHLLRSALDNQIFDMVLTHTNRTVVKPLALQFPIINDKSVSNGQLKFAEAAARNLSEIPPSAISLIETFQPYHGIAGRSDSYSGTYIHQLSLLQEISNQDKHRTVVSISVDPNRFEYTGETASLISQEYQKWISENTREYVANFVPHLMEYGAVIEEAVLANCGVNESVFAGFAIANVTLDERRPFASTLCRIKKFVELIVMDTNPFL